ncbi:YHS domain-containing protein [Mariprofundus ferrooxydans]|uniref:YHS n=1 Tax=Mariprofundus ferrooxydans PV-1 TaxID=314345 RepID=Q0F1J9_9PROT|nr:YHS domain-containing protein [Mariprofundus ferrooxydans]EAU55192.1 YHS [Mariprofundus ferrooxydans PV-1]
MQLMHMEEHTCPVCGMDAKDSTVHAEHTGIEYYFCTPQCRENFIARPQLYLGRQSAKSAGREIIKRRSFSLDQVIEGEMQAQLIQTMKQMMGVRDVEVNGRDVAITYDLLEATAEQMERALADAGAALGSGWAARLKRGWVQYTEENELDNLATGDAACCNKPPAKG